jgi:hypothetical protein
MGSSSMSPAPICLFDFKFFDTSRAEAHDNGVYHSLFGASDFSIRGLGLGRRSATSRRARSTGFMAVAEAYTSRAHLPGKREIRRPAVEAEFLHRKFCQLIAGCLLACEV